MKRIRLFILVLTAVLLAGAAATAETTENGYGPGLVRAAAGHGYEQARVLAERMGVDLTDGYPLYVPADPQPLNAYMVTHPDCEVGIDRDDMYKVSEKGLIPDITGYLNEWIDEIEAQSGGAIRFVSDPDSADVLVVAKQSYKYYGQYSGSGLTATGYSCTVGLTAVQLSDPGNKYGITATREPENTVSLRGGGKFWKVPPELEGTEKLEMLVDNILEWYGFGAKKGERGAGVKAAQQSLAERGYLAGGVDGDFGGKTEAALKLLQADYGLEETGEVDRKTLIALYYEPAALEALDGN